MNNAGFGKTQENLRNRVAGEIITDATTLRKRVAKPSLYRGVAISDDLVVIQCKQQTVAQDRPIYVGYTVLELSKQHMHSFLYEHMKSKYPFADQLKLLFTD